MAAVESIILSAHCCVSALSITISTLLIVIVFTHTPATFANFGIMIKFHALVDGCVALTTATGMHRVIAIDWSIVVVTYGPCRQISFSACYVLQTILLGAQSCTYFTNLASFAFRYMTIHGKDPSARESIGLICTISLPLPILCTMALLAARGDSGQMRELMYARRPESDADSYAVGGRSRIVAKIESEAQFLSEKSRHLQRRFVTMLTAQAAVPLVQLYAVSTFLLGFFDIVQNRGLEMSALLKEVQPEIDMV